VQEQIDAAHVAMPAEPPCVFLSYGVYDASELAESLRRDLMARDYQVWWDVNRIRAGRPWDEEVQTGLRNSQVLLALLSPQSVRRAQDPGNPTATDSVCLDEIEYAQRGKSRSRLFRWFPARLHSQSTGCRSRRSIIVGFDESLIGNRRLDSPKPLGSSLDGLHRHWVQRRWSPPSNFFETFLGHTGELKSTPTLFVARTG
jgi:TIR domain